MPVDGLRYNPHLDWDLKSRQPDDEAKRRASLIVAAYAVSVDDCRDLLGMLGLLEGDEEGTD